MLYVLPTEVACSQHWCWRHLLKPVQRPCHRDGDRGGLLCNRRIVGEEGEVGKTSCEEEESTSAPSPLYISLFPTQEEMARNNMGLSCPQVTYQWCHKQRTQYLVAETSQETFHNYCTALLSLSSPVPPAWFVAGQWCWPAINHFRHEVTINGSDWLESDPATLSSSSPRCHN
jgi:hypothetical protein